MSDFTARIDTRLSNINKKRSDLTKACDLPESAVRRWVGGSVPAADTAVKIARFLGVSVEYLITGEDSANGPKLAPEEFNLISGYRTLDERDRQNVLIFVEGLVSRYTEARGASTITG